MPFQLDDDDVQTRERMSAELEADVAAGRVYLSAVANEGTEGAYYEMLRAAFRDGTTDSLAHALATSGIFRTQQRNGAHVNVAEAASRLADGQFLHYYDRAICARAVEGGREVEVYRGQMTVVHRLESDAAVGQRLDPSTLLEDLRANSREPWRAPIVGKANSGLAIRIA